MPLEMTKKDFLWQSPRLGLFVNDSCEQTKYLEDERFSLHYDQISL